MYFILGLYSRTTWQGAMKNGHGVSTTMMTYVLSEFKIHKLETLTFPKEEFLCMVWFSKSELLILSLDFETKLSSQRKFRRTCFLKWKISSKLVIELSIRTSFYILTYFFFSISGAVQCLKMCRCQPKDYIDFHHKILPNSYRVQKIRA